jgi:16S rRNA (cytidine1402-2'-O)-methyltransferase
VSKLIVVPTPIGNLNDITLRAIEVLRNADVILAEDTRTSSVLLNHLGIEKRMYSHHAFNEHHTLSGCIEMLRSGKSIALISDAGTPGISDPGFLLIRECINQHIEVECLPGPSAFLPALVVSGLPFNRFCFEGFLPVKKGRQTALKKLAQEERTMIFYESPHKILKTLHDFRTYFGSERKASVSRELTKKFEETVRGSLQEIIDYFEKHPPKGEFVIVVNGC